jgi:hypothetical protein
MLTYELDENFTEHTTKFDEGTVIFQCNLHLCQQSSSLGTRACVPAK